MSPCDQHGHDYVCVQCGAPDTCMCGPRPLLIRCTTCGHESTDDSAPSPSAHFEDLVREAEEARERELAEAMGVSDDCATCGGSGGGEGPWRCLICRGSGKAPDYEEDYYDG